MKPFLFVPLLWLSLTVLAQPAAYHSFEVDSVADPRGGMAYLTTFVQANLRKPVAAQAQGIGGLVVVSGTVGADGRMGEVEVLRSLRPDCDREAVRVFKLFNAWKPAQKGGQAVRQRVTIPIQFTANTPIIYRYGARLAYFNTQQQPVDDSTAAQYKQVTPVDSIGLPAGDMVIYTRKGKRWEEVSRAPFVRKDNKPSGASNRATYFLGYPSSLYEYDGQLAIIDQSGELVRRAYFQKGKRVGPELHYHANGVVAERIDGTYQQTDYTYWYPNGQMKEAKTVITTEPATSVPIRTEQVHAYWDSTGKQMLDKGTGHVVHQSIEPSKADTMQYVSFTEEGDYKNGVKQGRWIGRYQDESYQYEELYEQGVCQSGKAKTIGADTVRYTTVEQMPEFSGGVSALGQFLAQNLRYPASAQRAGRQGSVFVSFVVCQDGTLCNYRVIRAAYDDLNEEAIRVVQKSNGRWKPGLYRGEKIRVSYKLPVNFSLE